MGASDSVAAHGLEYLQLAFYGAPVGCGAQAAQVVVIADSVYEYVLAVQEESAVSAEFNCADSERGYIFVNGFLVHPDLGNHGVHVWVINTPQMGVCHIYMLLEGVRAACGNHMVCHLGDSLAVGIDNSGPYGDLGRFGTVVLNG